MKKTNQVMVVLAIAVIIILGMVNLHCLYQPEKERLHQPKGTGKGNAMDLTVRFELFPSLYLNIAFDNR